MVRYDGVRYGRVRLGLVSDCLRAGLRFGVVRYDVVG